MNHRPGRGLLHPGPVIAIALLVLNDHVLKAAFPGFITGKLSDVAGLAFFPLFLQALAELCGAPVSRRRTLAAACAATAIVFAAVKGVPLAHDAYELGLAWLQAPFRGLVGATPAERVALQMDPTDLLAIPAVGLAWRWGRNR